MTRKFVIAGGPSTGKTSVINELEKQGIRVFHEVAREVLKEKKFSKEAQYEIFKKQLEQSKQADKLGGTIFLDRGIPDSLAYFKYHNFEIPDEILEQSKPKKTKYEIVFFLEPVGYKCDEVRKESKEEAEKIHKRIYDVYNELGYNIIKVPFMSVEKRVEFIKSFL